MSDAHRPSNSQLTFSMENGERIFTAEDDGDIVRVTIRGEKNGPHEYYYLDEQEVTRLMPLLTRFIGERRASDEPSGPLKLDNERQVFFYEQDHYYLSNFSAFMVQWNGHVYPTSEHAYHVMKFPDDPLKQAAIARASSAHDVFKMAERWKQYRRPDWDEIKVEVMRHILRTKVDQHEYVRRKLLETGDRELIENSWRDDYWGWGPNRDGQNMLGKLWMQIRADLRGPSVTKSAGSSDNGLNAGSTPAGGSCIDCGLSRDEHDDPSEFRDAVVPTNGTGRCFDCMREGPMETFKARCGVLICKDGCKAGETGDSHG